MCDDARVLELEDRVKVLELAVSELAHRTPAPPPGVVKSVFGIPVVLAPDVDDQRIADAVAGLPRGLDADEVVHRLQVDRLLVRTSAGRR